MLEAIIIVYFAAGILNYSAEIGGGLLRVLFIPIYPFVHAIKIWKSQKFASITITLYTLFVYLIVYLIVLYEFK